MKPRKLTAARVTLIILLTLLSVNTCFATCLNAWKKTKNAIATSAIGSRSGYVKSAGFSRCSLEKLVDAIAVVESGNNATAVGDRGRAAGILQIHHSVLLDVNRKYGTCYKWPGDAFNIHHARNICKLYLQIYCPANATLEKLSRCWNGGPKGYKKKSTEQYWKKIKQILK